MVGMVDSGVWGGCGRLARGIAVVALSLMASACSSLGDGSPLDLLAANDKPAEPVLAPNEGGAPQSELGKATEYWGKQYAKKPNDADAALAYAKNLKAQGNKSEAFAVLQQAAQINSDHKPLAAEYGRLALEFDRVSLAAQLLQFADDPVRPDWRVVSARGAALAKLGKYKDAVQQLERANTLAPDQPSVQNNLALAYAMSGDPAKAETLLRQAVARDGGSAKTKQNLALVLGLQGKYDEATSVGATVVAADVARENTDVLRKMVKLDPKVTAPFTAPAAIAAVPAPSAPVAFKPATIETGSGEAWGSTVVSAAP
jgi:Flp pilus assembly protein TadD